MNQFFTKKMASTSCIIMNTFLLLIHIGFFVFFIYYHIRYMYIFNVFSMVFYACGYFFIRKEMLSQYFQLVAVEVMLHMVLATICLGCGYGFQLCLLGMVPVYFYGNYFSMQVQKKKVHGIFLGILSMILYIVVYARERFRGPHYVIDDNVQFVIRICMGVINFAIIILCMSLLIRHVIASESELLRKADYDALTKLPNRYYMLDRLEDIYNGKNKNDHWVAMIDIDDFKKVNDRYGHNFGDYVLIRVADILMHLDGIDACRWGGEEFLLTGKLDDTHDIPVDKLDRIRADIAKMQLKQGDIHTSVTITIGAAGCKDGLSVKEWIQIADKCLYVGKYNGKNRVVK